MAAEENRSGRKRKRKTISIGSTPSSTTEIPKTSENSNNPSKERKKSRKTMTLKEGRVVETPTNAESSLEKNKDTKKQNTKDTKREVIKIEDSGSEESENETKTFNPEKIQKSLRFQFVITLIAGSALIFFNPAVTILNWPAVSQIFISVGLMGLFWLLALKNLRTTVARAVFADSMYYLGFLFTFVALVAAMMSLASLEGKKFEIETIIGQMGPALITTVVGMAVRIYLTQFDAITDEPETEILNLVGKMTSRLIPALEQLEEVIKTNQEVMERHQKNSEEQINRFAQSLEGLNFQNVKTELDGLGDSFRKVVQETENMAFSTKTATSKLMITSDELNKVTDETTRVKENLKKVEDISENVDSINKKVTKAEESFENSVNKMESNIQNAASRIHLSSTNIASKMQGIEDEAKTLSNRIKNALSDVVSFLNRKK